MLEDDLQSLSFQGGGRPIKASLDPVGGAIAAICAKDRPPHQWFSLIEEDMDQTASSNTRGSGGSRCGSGGTRGSASNIDALAPWWVETAWKDSMCLNPDSLTPSPDEDYEELKPHLANVATKVITFDEYGRIAIIGLFKDAKESLHFLILWAERSKVHPSWLQMAVEWVTEDFKKIIAQVHHSCYMGVGAQLPQDIGQGLWYLSFKLKDWCRCMNKPLRPPEIKSSSSSSSWENWLAECVADKRKMQLTIDLVSFALSRLRLVLVGRDDVDMWLNIIALFMPIHRAHFATHRRSLEMKVVVGMHVQGIETTHDPFVDSFLLGDEMRQLVERIPTHWAGCVVHLDEAKLCKEGNPHSPKWARVTKGDVTKGDLSWVVPEEFVPPGMIAEMVETVARSMSIISQMRRGGAAEENIRYEWTVTSLLLQQWKQQLMHILLETGRYLSETSNNIPVAINHDQLTFVDVVNVSLERPIVEATQMLRGEATFRLGF